MLDEHILELLGAEAVEGVGPRKHMPAEMGLRRTFGHERFGLKLFPYPILRICDMEVERNVRSFRAVQIDVLEAAAVELGDFRSDLILNIAVLIRVAA